MANNFVNSMKQNMPVICTVGSIIMQIGTAGLAFYEGYKFKSEWDALPDNATTKVKALKIIRRVTPVLASCTSGCVLTYGIYSSGQAQIAGLAAAYASAKLENQDLKEFKEKAKEALGEENTKKVEDEIKEEKISKTAMGMGLANPDDLIQMHDLTTGYTMKTTLRDLFDAITDYNEVVEIENQPISYFYERARTAGVIYADPEPIYDDTYVIDGKFNPKLDYEPGPNMLPVLTIEWDKQRANYPNEHGMRSRCGGYVY